MPKFDFLECPHMSVDGYTQCCDDCGENIWTTDDEYIARKNQEKRNAKREENRKKYYAT